MPKKPSSRPRRNPPPASTQPPTFSRLAMDQTMASLQKLLASQDFQSIDEANAFLQKTLQEHGGRVPEVAPSTPLEEAQVLVAQAFEVAQPSRKRALAQQALNLSPDCADAYALLAELEPKPYRQLELMEQAVAAGKRALGETRFKELEGGFWGFVETRPFMRANAAVGELSWALGDRARAVAIYTEMLRLNPGDNQGVRYMLATCLLEERTQEAQAALENLLGRFPEDAAANWAYSRALLFFQLQGHPTDQANQALGEALQANPHVPPLLLGEEPMPHELPRFIGMGDVAEAVEYVAFSRDAWRHTSGALPWLRQQHHP